MENELNKKMITSKKNLINLTKESKVVIFFMSLFILLNYLSAFEEAAVMSVCSLYPISIWLNRRKLTVITTASLFILSFVILFSIIVYNVFTLYYFISELKILVLFTLPSFFYLVMKDLDYEEILKSFFKCFSIFVLITTLYGYSVFNEFRYTGILDHSIYISVCLVLLMSYLYTEITLRWVFITLFNVLMLGSSNGLMIFIIVWGIKVSLPVILKIVPSYFSLFYFYWYVTDFRGREIADGGFWEIDRVILINSLNRFIIEEFSLFNYIFGYGIGRPLSDFQLITRISNNEVNGFVQWFNDFSSGGVFPFSFHNEFARIFFNFGLIGIILIFFFLYSYLDKTTFFVLIIACITNTIIYSTVGLFVLSIMMAVTMLNKGIEDRTENFSSSLLKV